MFRKLTSNALYVFFRNNTLQANGEISYVRRFGGVWDAAATLLKGGAATGWSSPSAEIDSTSSGNKARVIYATGTASPFTLKENYVTTGADFTQALTGALSFAGSAGKRGLKALAGTLTSSGSDAFRTNKSLSATLSSSGSLPKSTSRTTTGSLSFVGGMTKSSRRLLSGVVSFATGIAFNGAHIFTQAFTAALSFTGSANKSTRRGFAATLSSVGSLPRKTSRAFAASLSLLGTYSGTRKRWFEAQARAFARTAQVLTRFIRTPSVTRAQVKYPASIRIVGPNEMNFMAGTAILFEVTFNDKDGNLVDPDVGSIKLFLKKPDAFYLTGYDPAVSGGAMSKLSTGVYQFSWQSARTDPLGTWSAECQGVVATYTSVDEIRFSLKA
jgi:hypothetical protein